MRGSVVYEGRVAKDGAGDSERNIAGGAEGALSAEEPCSTGFRSSGAAMVEASVETVSTSLMGTLASDMASGSTVAWLEWEGVDVAASRPLYDLERKELSSVEAVSVIDDEFAIEVPS